MIEANHSSLLSEVATYYSQKLVEHGETPRGVDWNGHDSQHLRFRQLAKLFNKLQPFSVNDLGCGYGAFYDFLTQEYDQFSYAGIDVSGAMVSAAQQRYPDTRNARFICASQPDKISDYGVASGIFNVRLERSTTEWFAYIEATLDQLNQTSQIGFAFNCLTSYSDADKMKTNLYYADPCVLFALCKNKYSRQVALLHDYGLYEFTILVRKV